MRRVTTLLVAFSQMVDPRCRRGVRHPFAGLVTLMLLGMLAASHSRDQLRALLPDRWTAP